MVELPIIEHVLNTFQYFAHSLTKCVIERANWRDTIVLSVAKVTEHCRKHSKRMRDSLIQLF
jgi:hypothetical protein